MKFKEIKELSSDELVTKKRDLRQESLHLRLQQIDPYTAARRHPNDLRRVIRALEVIELTGWPMSAQHREEPVPPSQRPEKLFESWAMAVLITTSRRPMTTCRTK